MTSCATPPLDAPVISITLVGTGEPLLRMEKRLSCAAAGVGVRLVIDICKDADAMGIPYVQTPAVLHEGRVIFNGLPRTEEIEAWLRLIGVRLYERNSLRSYYVGCAVRTMVRMTHPTGRRYTSNI